MDSSEPPSTKTARAEHSQGYPRVQCPHCGEMNSFPQLDMVLMFLCHYCGEPVDVEQPKH
jgi:hypothetical protein